MTEQNRSSQLFWGLLSLALAIVVASVVGAGAVKKIKLANDTITVTGSARKPVRSDYIVWQGAVSSQKPGLQEAYRDVSRYSDRLREYFRVNQVPDSSVSFKPVQTMTVMEYTADGRMTGRISAYQLRQPFEIRSDQVDAITELSGKAAELINEGIMLESYSPQYLYTRLSEVRSEILAEAAADARRRAESIAGSVGSRIGAIRSARMGVFQVTARNSTDVSDYGIYDTMALEKDITAVVSITFAVK
jgi:hypothetical protein